MLIIEVATFETGFCFKAERLNQTWLSWLWLWCFTYYALFFLVFEIRNFAFLLCKWCFSSNTSIFGKKRI